MRTYMSETVKKIKELFLPNDWSKDTLPTD